jgi:hypothetical protein
MNELGLMLQQLPQNKPLLELQLTVAGVISEAFKEFGIIPVVVGGSAVEFYTLGSYTTRDIDLIVEDPEYIQSVMPGLGFSNDAGTWYLPGNPSVVVEFPKGPLAGDRKRVQPVQLPNHHIAYLISLEDILIDRTLAAKYWTDGSEEWVRFMMVAHYEDIDWKYLRNVARQELCLDTLTKARNWARRKRKKLSHK